ncbi:acyl-CoA thioesterase [Nocardia sp. CA-128927]|uniref:acyl-CoA thioesterase n=1 Tax=Nocardia sp. CA-128927 TaxID=3239975 RepID=UPI003D960F38
MTALQESPGLLIPNAAGTFSQYRLEHVVTFGETSRAGFVYYRNLIDWQGVCRERFAFDYIPEYMMSLRKDIAMLTTSVTCEYAGEVYETDRISIRMSIPWIRLHFMAGEFEYYRITDDGEQPIASGIQLWANTRRTGDPDSPDFVPEPWTREVIDVCTRMGTDLTRALVK